MEVLCVCSCTDISLFSSCVCFGYCSQILCHTRSPPVSFCLTGKDKDEGGRFKSNTSPGRHGSVWSSIISLYPPCASLELGCFHGNQVFDGQVCVWWPVLCESFHPLLPSKRDAKVLACLYLYTVIYTERTHTYTYTQYMHCDSFTVKLQEKLNTCIHTSHSARLLLRTNAHIIFFYSQSHTPTVQYIQT